MQALFVRSSVRIVPCHSNDILFEFVRNEAAMLGKFSRSPSKIQIFLMSDYCYPKVHLMLCYAF